MSFGKYTCLKIDGADLCLYNRKLGDNKNLEEAFDKAIPKLIPYATNRGRFSSSKYLLNFELDGVIKL